MQELGTPYEGPGRPLFAITCSLCSGSDPECKVCSGSGEERIYACPGALVDAESSEVLSAYADWQLGLLPDAGPIEDQAAPCVELVRVVSAELGRIHDEDRKQAELRAASSRTRSSPRRGKTPNRVG